MRPQRAAYADLHSANNATEQPPQRKDFMDYQWKIFSICGIPIHVHVLLPLFFVLSFIFWARIIANDSSHFGYYFLLIFLYNLVLWITVLIHELGHCFFGWLTGGHSEKILLWPLGGLAFTQPSSSNTSCSQVLIALGGPLTHIPNMIFWGVLLYWKANQKADESWMIPRNPFSTSQTWNETIIVPIVDFVDYDFLMLAFTLNFWLFVVNLLLPAFPLDGSKIFVKILRRFYGLRTTAQIYAATNAIIGVGFIILSYTYLKSGSMCQFAGFWGVIQCHIMVQLLIQNREFTHPLFVDEN